MELRPPPRPTRRLSPMLKAQLKPSKIAERIRLRQQRPPAKSPLKLLKLQLKLLLATLLLMLPPLHPHLPVLPLADAHSESKYD